MSVAERHPGMCTTDNILCVPPHMEAVSFLKKRLKRYIRFNSDFTDRYDMAQ